MERVIITDNYLMRFNYPRKSKFHVVQKRFVPWRKLWRPLDALGTWLPDFSGYSLVHSFNRIPLTAKPWIVTFESQLPRTLGRGEPLKRVLRERLNRPNCRRIIAMSRYAERQFLDQNKGWQRLDEVSEKLEVIPPNVPLRKQDAKRLRRDGVLRAVFVGNDFARKGGVVCVRAAEKALKRRLKVQFDLVSGLRLGPNSYCDHLNGDLYRRDLKLLDLPNVTFRGALPNGSVLQQFAESDLNLLPTLDDTYGFSILEAFAAGLPTIATEVCAIPEFVIPNETGLLVKLAALKSGRWAHIEEERRDTKEFWEILNTTYETLAEQMVDYIEMIISDPDEYEKLSYGAIERIRRHHNSETVSRKLDDLYEQCLTQ